MKEVIRRVMKEFKLNGRTMPRLGFGTFGLMGITGRNAVRDALDCGYRHIDTARMYDNEEDIAAGIREAGLPREDLFLTTKIWFDDLSPEGIDRQLTVSLQKLDTDHADLVLIHWPNDDYPIEETLEALEEQRARGRTRLIGVSNFTPSQVEKACGKAAICCNQVEYHPLLDQSRLLAQARRLGLVLTAYCPLGQGDALGEETVREIARRHGREPSQVVLRWHMQQDGVAAIPRSSNPDHIRSNLEVFDFLLADEEMRAISGLSREERRVDPDWAPEWNS